MIKDLSDLEKRVLTLIKSGRILSMQETAREANTTKNVVYKIRSILKTKGFVTEEELRRGRKKGSAFSPFPNLLSDPLTEQKATDTITSQPSILESEGRQRSFSTGDNHNVASQRQYGYRELSEEDYKILYSAFKEGKQPPEIIREYGYLPDIVELEYQRFLKYRDCNVFAIPEQLLSAFADNDSRDEIKKLALEYRKKGYWSTAEIVTFVELVIEERLEPRLFREASAEEKQWMQPMIDKSIKKTIPDNVFDHLVRDALHDSPQTVPGMVLKKRYKL